MTWGPGTGRRQRALTCRAVLTCLVFAGLSCSTATAQTLTRDLMNPVRGGFFQSQDSYLRRTSDAGDDDGASPSSTAAPSRIGRIPTYGVPAAAGAGDTGYDSLNRRRKKSKPYPGAPKPKQPPGPGNFIAVPPPPPLSVPPSSTANKTPIAPAMAGRVDGQPVRRRLRLDDDPFGAVGDYVGSFLVKSAVELWGGYDTNPGRFDQPKGSAFYMVSPEFVAKSTGSATPSSPTCAARSRDTARHFRRWSTAPASRLCRPYPRAWIGRISPARSTGVSTSHTIPVSIRNCGCMSVPTIRQPATFRLVSASIRYMRPPAGPPASSMISTGCKSR